MKIYFGPAIGRGQIDDVWDSCRLKLLQQPNILYRPESGDSLVSRSRSIAASEFLRKSEADVLLTIDTDIVFKAADALRICEVALERQAIVCGVYKCRSNQNTKPASVLERGVVLDSQSSVPVPLRWGATGFMAAPRSIVQATTELVHFCHEDADKPFWPVYMPFEGKDDDGKWIYLSEDYAFCERARSLGYEILALPDVRLGHMGTTMFQFSEQPYRLERLDEPGYHYALYEAEASALVAASA